MSPQEDIDAIKTGTWYSEFSTMHGAAKAQEHMLVETDEYLRAKLVGELTAFFDGKTAAEVRAIYVVLMGGT